MPPSHADSTAGPKVPQRPVCHRLFFAEARDVFHPVGLSPVPGLTLDEALLYVGWAEAHRLLQRLEIRYTPEHSSWPNVAGIENSAVACQCLPRQISENQVMVEETSVWSKRRNYSTGRHQ